MNTPDPGKFNIPVEAVAALTNGNKIEAIKIIREKTGLGLKEAKDLVDHYSDGSSEKTATHQVSGSFEHGHKSDQMNLPAAARAELTKGNKIGAIKIVREANNSGLKDAKDFVEHYIEGDPPLKARLDKIQAESFQVILKWFTAIVVLTGLCIYAFK